MKQFNKTYNTNKGLPPFYHQKKRESIVRPLEHLARMLYAGDEMAGTLEAVLSTIINFPLRMVGPQQTTVDALEIQRKQVIEALQEQHGFLERFRVQRELEEMATATPPVATTNTQPAATITQPAATITQPTATTTQPAATINQPTAAIIQPAAITQPDAPPQPTATTEHPTESAMDEMDTTLTQSPSEPESQSRPDWLALVNGLTENVAAEQKTKEAAQHELRLAKETIRQQQQELATANNRVAVQTGHVIALGKENTKVNEEYSALKERVQGVAQNNHDLRVQVQSLRAQCNRAKEEVERLVRVVGEYREREERIGRMLKGA